LCAVFISWKGACVPWWIADSMHVWYHHRSCSIQISHNNQSHFTQIRYNTTHVCHTSYRFHTALRHISYRLDTQPVTPCTCFMYLFEVTPPTLSLYCTCLVLGMWTIFELISFRDDHLNMRYMMLTRCVTVHMGFYNACGFHWWIY
jgi:hypothetical protein